MSIEHFHNHQYINIETFRKNGQGVCTPVWFARDGHKLYIWTETNSGKAKRARNIPKVNIAPCQGNGDLLGDWLPAAATCDDSPATIQYVRRLFVQKYGIAFHIFALLGKLRRAHFTTLCIDFELK